MEVEDVDKLSSFINNNLVLFVLQGDILMKLDHSTENGLIVAHLPVKLTKLTVSQVWVVQKTPLSSAIMVAIVVALSWEIDPLRMAKFVAHEIEVCFTAQGLSDQSNHFMESDTSAYP